MSYWKDVLDAAMNTGEASEDYGDVQAGLEGEDDTCPHGVGFDEECEECEENDAE